MASGVLLTDGLAGGATPFERMPLRQQAFDEAWLRDLLHDTPDLIPLEEAFPGTRGLCPVCTELPLADGGTSLFLDVFGITPAGRPVLIECKLWRNPEARRRVVTQILEYATLLRGLSYGSLEATLKRRLGWRGENPLFHHVAQRFPDLDETAFVNGVTRSLEVGDFLLLIAGDGIRTDAQTLVRLLEGTGLVARLSMMEVRLWRDPEGGAVFVAPSVPTRVDVERYRVVVDPDGRPLRRDEEAVEDVDPPDGAAPRATGRGRDPEEIKAEKAFWTEMLESLRFDNPDQDMPTYRHPNNARASFPAPADRLVLFRSRTGQVGVFVAVQRDQAGARLAEALAEDLDAISREVGLPVMMMSGARRDAPRFNTSTVLDLQGPDLERSQAAWLCMAANRMVNALRPRVERYAASNGPA